MKQLQLKVIALAILLGAGGLCTIGCEEWNNAQRQRGASSDVSQSDMSHSRWHASGGGSSAPATQP